MKCPNCNKEINDSFKFCPYCATPIATNKCPHCGSINLPADSKFCPDCGCKIESIGQHKDIDIQVGRESFKMVLVEGGSFIMGATSEMKNARDDEYPTHKVTLDTFYLSEIKVTQGLWEEIMGLSRTYNPSQCKNMYYPIEHLDWQGVQLFIQKLNQRTGFLFRLPTESEWEYAARGGNKGLHTQFSGSNNIDEVAWYSGNAKGPHSSRQKKPNELGIHDMTSDSLEWCNDWYGEYVEGHLYNPSGPKTGTHKVLRGISYLDDAKDSRISRRWKHDPNKRAYRTTIRLALSK